MCYLQGPTLEDIPYPVRMEAKLGRGILLALKAHFFSGVFMLLLLTPFFFAFILVFLAVGSWAVVRVPFGFRHTGPDFRHGGKVLLLSACAFCSLVSLHRTRTP